MRPRDLIAREVKRAATAFSNSRTHERVSRKASGMLTSALETGVRRYGGQKPTTPTQTIVTDIKEVHSYRGGAIIHSNEGQTFIAADNSFNNDAFKSSSAKVTGWPIAEDVSLISKLELIGGHAADTQRLAC
ncbi:hypothetical protein FOL47_010793 [Perkinsus chesapeaki]|uniref:Uncharacterized protein n=1 Tax=Perkinsus chesapeaki TaxID=330153 RepID=A0A7J6KZZ8_PERCH|nr:hypothetical protein FOL47_010793 [Perkinsus chesapeaki]